MHIDLIELSPDKTFNLLWISEVFQRPARYFDGVIRAGTFPVFIVQDCRYWPSEERSLRFDLFPYLNKIGCSFGLIHILDEVYGTDFSAYDLDKCSVVFREYFKPNGGGLQLLKDYGKSFCYPIYNAKYSGFKLLGYKICYRFARFHRLKNQHLPNMPDGNILYFPIGYTDKFANTREPDIAPVVERRFKWSFCGDSFKTDRRIMLKSLSTIRPNFVYEFRGFMGEQSLSGEDYSEILNQSIFVPCPRGFFNIETYRIFEALEAGAIPIVLRSHAWQPYDYFQSLLGEHPIPTFQSWRDARFFLNDISLKSTLRISKAIAEWYESYKVNLQRKVKKILLNVAKDNLVTDDISVIDKCQPATYKCKGQQHSEINL